MHAGAATPVSFWQVPQVELDRQLGSGAKGLTAREAEERLLRYGPNAFAGRRRYGLARKMASRFRNPLVLILIGAALISALTGEISSFVIISVIVLLSVVLDSLQEYRAEEAADRLRASVALMERVLRDGREVTVKAEALVPGDLVLLSAGDLVPADGRLVEAKDFFVNEALLTGEAFPTEKHAIAEGVRESEITGATKCRLHGKLRGQRHGAFLVVATGPATQLGAISTGLRHTPPPGGPGAGDP
jgi:Cation transport ATPase